MLVGVPDSASLSMAYRKKNAAPDGRPEAKQPRVHPGGLANVAAFFSPSF